MVLALLGVVGELLLLAGRRPVGQLRLESVLLDAGETRILAGAPRGRYVDRLGHVWLSDRFFSGGTAVETASHPVARTPDPTLYQARREGEFTYDIPLHPGTYELRLYFAETVYGGETSRLFAVTANGRPLLASFDIISDAGGDDIADLKVFRDISPDRDGALHLHFQGEGRPALLNAIEVLPAAGGSIRPIRILAQEGMYVDKQGRVWSGDRFFRGGNTVVRSSSVSNVPDPAIFRGERYGYTIPVAQGRYTITLHFAETWFGPGKPGGGGAGSRVFDVYCNGLALLKNFDILKAAGAPDAAVHRTFGPEPNAQDKFVISLVPVRNHACVNAIEVE